jgi:hypothetical protein
VRVHLKIKGQLADKHHLLKNGQGTNNQCISFGSTPRPLPITGTEIGKGQQKKSRL